MTARSALTCADDLDTFMADILDVIVSIGFHGLALAMVLYLISVGLSVTMLYENSRNAKVRR